MATTLESMIDKHCPMTCHKWRTSRYSLQQLFTFNHLISRHHFISSHLFLWIFLVNNAHIEATLSHSAGLTWLNKHEAVTAHILTSSIKINNFIKLLWTRKVKHEVIPCLDVTCTYTLCMEIRHLQMLRKI